jgi:hypothetical protein
MLNRNKKDINSYVNGNDLERYLSHLRFNNPFIFRHSEIGNDIGELFQGNNSIAIILLHDQHPSGIGHYVCLRKDREEPTGVTHYTWFDCLGDPIPEDIREKFTQESKVTFLDQALMSKTENLCGKYCIAFVNAGNIPVEQFAKLLSGSKYSPDQIIANMYRLNYGDNIL